MHYKKRNRFILVITIFILSLIGTYIVLYNLNEHIVFFHPPSEIYKIKNKKIRIGGIVKQDSINYKSNNKISFKITDHSNDIIVYYSGILPALFRENQGIIAEGILSNNIFLASKLLTKHDENYKPPITIKENENKKS